MKLWKFIRRLNLRQLWALMKLSLVNPAKVWPTWVATRQSVAYAEKYYGKQHQKNTAANAFRHALWNFLIAQKCLKKESDMEEVLSWTKDITDMHEELFPNDKLAREMDLHNNKIGRLIFPDYRNRSEEEVLTLMREMAEQSILIKNTEDLENIPEGRFVHLINA